MSNVQHAQDPDQIVHAVPEVNTDTRRLEAPRYLFSAGDLPGSMHPEIRPAGGIDLGPMVIRPHQGPPGFVHRCAVAPCFMSTKKVLQEEVPEGMRAYGLRQEFDRAGDNQVYGHILLHPGPAVDALILNYGGWGLIELKALYDYPAADVQKLSITKQIFPEWPKLPVTNRGVWEHLEKQRKLFSSNSLFTSMIDDMIYSAHQADLWMRTVLDETHGAMQLPGTHLHHKARYDKSDLHFLDRTGLERRDQQLGSIVDTQHKLASVLERQLQPVPASPPGYTFDQVKEMMKEQAQQIAQQVAALYTKPAPPPEDDPFPGVPPPDPKKKA